MERDTKLAELLHETQRLQGRLSELQEQQVSLTIEIYRISTKAEKLRSQLESLQTELQTLRQDS